MHAFTMSRVTYLILSVALLVAAAGLISVEISAQSETEETELLPILAVDSINDRTLTIVVAGAVLGSIAINLLGYEHTRNKNPAEKYSWAQLTKTLVFAVPVGTLLATTATDLLNIDTGNSTIQAVVLLMQAVVFAMGAEWWKQRTAN